MSEHISLLAEWALGWRADVEALQKALAEDEAHLEVRRRAAAALNYVVSRMDLVPDWEPTVGLFDDLMVARICAAQAIRSAGSDLHLDERTTAAIKRLADEAERLRDFLGDELFGKLDVYCDRQTQAEVRGRTPDQLIADPKVRAQLDAELADALARTGAVPVPDAAQAAVRLKAYLGHKLK